MPGRDWLLVILGAVGFIVLSHQIPILRQLNATGNINNTNIENIEGIDLNALLICRQKGLM